MNYKNLFAILTLLLLCIITKGTSSNETEIPFNAYIKPDSSVVNKSSHFHNIVNTSVNDKKSENEFMLKEILKNCARYCEKLEKTALYFVCEEKIREEIILKQEVRMGRGYLPAEKEINSYIYDYQLIRKGKEFRESRILIKENGEKKNIKNAPLKTKRFFSLKSVYGPVGFLSQDSQEEYNYKLLKEDMVNGRKAYVIEVLPKTSEVKNPNFGKLWVDQKEFFILKIEITQESLVGFEEAKKELKEQMEESGRGALYKYHPELTVIHDYGVEKNGIRFPSKTAFEEAYKIYSIRHKQWRTYKRSKVVIEFENYKFFTVETDVSLL